MQKIQRVNGLGNRTIDLSVIYEKIRFKRYEARERSFFTYFFCTKNFFNIVILMLLQIISSGASYMLYFEFQYIDGKRFERTLFAASSYFVGCLFGGLLLSKISSTRIKSSKGKLRNLKCVFVTMFTISLAGSLLLIAVQKASLSQGYIEVIIFVVQCGISSSIVCINVTVLIIISVNHRLKLYALL